MGDRRDTVSPLLQTNKQTLFCVLICKVLGSTGTLAFQNFNQSKCTVQPCQSMLHCDWSNVWKAGVPVLLKCLQINTQNNVNSLDLSFPLFLVPKLQSSQVISKIFEMTVCYLENILSCLILIFYWFAWMEHNWSHYGGFQLEFVRVSRFINHMTCYKFECSHWWWKNLYNICSPVWMLWFKPMKALKL